MITPYYDQDGITIYCGDCRLVLPQLDVKVDLVLTDPPYGINYANHPVVGTHKYKIYTHQSMDWDNAKADNLETIIKLADYSIIWGGNYYSLTPSRCWIVWFKPDAPPSIGDCELAWTNIDKPSIVISQSIAATNSERVGHATQKPLRLIKKCIAFAPQSNLILDPFLGSGTTAVAAKILGRRCIGIEIEEKYCDIAVERLRQSVMKLQ
jgi:site-specific DNA-methyltransferase (adenine-specific)